MLLPPMTRSTLKLELGRDPRGKPPADTLLVALEHAWGAEGERGVCPSSIRAQGLSNETAGKKQTAWPPVEHQRSCRALAAQEGVCPSHSMPRCSSGLCPRHLPRWVKPGCAASSLWLLG